MQYLSDELDTIDAQCLLRACQQSCCYSIDQRYILIIQLVIADLYACPFYVVSVCISVPNPMMIKKHFTNGMGGILKH